MTSFFLTGPSHSPKMEANPKYIDSKVPKIKTLGMTTAGQGRRFHSPYCTHKFNYTHSHFRDGNGDYIYRNGNIPIYLYKR